MEKTGSNERGAGIVDINGKYGKEYGRGAEHPPGKLGEKQDKESQGGADDAEACNINRRMPGIPFRDIPGKDRDKCRAGQRYKEKV